MLGSNIISPSTTRPRRTFTVLLPVVRPPFFLPYAVKSVLNQTVTDLELCIICDGAPPETVDCAQHLAQQDDRIFVFPFQKGERHGEAYRDWVLKGADSEFVAQIGDDDLWFPDHLTQLHAMLRTVDFAALAQVRLMPDGAVSPIKHFACLSEPAVRDKMLTELWNFFGPSEAGYRLSTYRALPVGWSPAPADIVTDLFMWRKFFRQPGLSYASRFAVTCLKFGAFDWREVGAEALAKVIRHEALRLNDANRQAQVMQIAANAVLEDARIRETSLKLQLDEREEAIIALERQCDEAALSKQTEATLSEQIKRVEHELSAVHQTYTSSLSWKVTAPLRWLSRLIRRLR